MDNADDPGSREQVGVMPGEASAAVLAPLWMRLAILAAIVVPVLLALVPESYLQEVAKYLSSDAATLLQLARSLQVTGFAGLFAVIIWQLGKQQGWAFGLALLKSVAFAILVGVPFTVGMLALSLLFLPAAPVWVHIAACTVPVIALVVGMSMWFSRGVGPAQASLK